MIFFIKIYEIMNKIAVIGSGISGLSCAYYLSKSYKVDLFEKNSYFGGHTHTQTIKYRGYFKH